ncbi:RVT_3 domain-containing protein [Cephalotus follicularis]|uniref:RVT_3 domain-containing protein n=1 Tax=Cephalotus follicularis TaxID=3775 RepID=A0A1Q3DCH2_CEPFO|nr:RVT_3 domain-containing protein [Cephalotus follicularis]
MPSLHANWLDKINLSSQFGMVSTSIAALTLWHIWLSRNSTIFAGTSMSWICVRNQVIQGVHDLSISFNPKIQDSYINQLRLNHLSLNQIPVVVQNGTWTNWQVPPYGSLKINTDGSCIDNACAGGGVVRDHTGMIILAFSSFFGIDNNAEAEAKSMHLGLRLCSERGLSISFMELDSLFLVNCFNDLWDPPWAIEYILRDCKNLIPSHASVSHVFREANGLTDRLAAHGHTCQGIFTFERDSLPTTCHAAYQADLLGHPQYRPP